MKDIASCQLVPTNNVPVVGRIVKQGCIWADIGLKILNIQNQQLCEAQTIKTMVALTIRIVI